MKHILKLIFGPLLFLLFGCTDKYADEVQKFDFSFQIATAGNSWVKNGDSYISSDILTNNGIRNWDDANDIIHTYFHTASTGEISLGIRAKVSSDYSSLKVNFENELREITLDNMEVEDIFIGNFHIEKPGYHLVEIIGSRKNGSGYADIDKILIGAADGLGINFIRDEFYWGRRGPSVHLNYELPHEVVNVQWFYSEVRVPDTQDVVGSYFMADGFKNGYFGIQVNSLTERRILFSIWSPFQTDDPNSIPEEDKIILLRKGNDVITGEFGNEGSGGQSYKIFSWKPDVYYGFLVGAQPTSENSTIYTAYFFDPEENQWSLIAQFKRPKTNAYLTNLYSFLENFIPQTGVLERKAYYNNQWVYDTSGWHEITKIRYTADNTARKQNRLDYSGGVENNSFFLKNCGFSDEQTSIDSYFTRDKLNIAPDIDFSTLP